ncbi:MAG TPA: SDR family oxidoreductase [Anaerolineae bacterium]|nr:SDR family oxidoreductase [Anaerolineae bacterium]
MAQRYDLQGQSAIVTGAGRRLGRAFAEALASCGANVAVHYGRTVTGAEETVQVALSHGVRAVALQADLSQTDQTSSLIERAVEALGEVTILINSASIFEPLDLMETTLEAWQNHLAINLTAPFLLSQSFGRHRAGRPGVIINILDWRALRPGPDHFPYTISKSGLAAMTQSLAQALAPNIRVNGLALGAILPPPGRKGFSEALIEDVPLKRWGSVEETVDSLLFLLAGPDFITGEILHLDGGRQLT